MRRYRRDGIKVIAFVAVTSLFSALVAITLGQFRIEPTETYHALFRDVSGLKPGADVRAAGVTVGRVSEIELEDDNTARVSFTVSQSLPLTTGVRVTVRWKNLIGDRYLDLIKEDDDARLLAPGDVIPLTQTSPALDLDVLFNGFKPLLQALDPRQVNELSGALIGVFQGQEETVQSLLGHVASVTSTLGQRDQLIGRVVDNLNTVLATIDSRRTEFSDLIVDLQGLVSGLAKDRRVIGESLVGVNALAGTTADLVASLRPGLHGTVAQVDRLSRVISAESGLVDHYLRKVPGAIRLLSRGGSYGSFFNFYLCGIRVKISGPVGDPIYTPFTLSEVPRCQFDQ